MGRVIPELENVLLRELIEGGLRILYEVFPDRVESGELHMGGSN
jgi:hypothetical protein